MTSYPVHIRELTAWGLDDYAYRPKSFEYESARQLAHIVAQRKGSEQVNVVLPAETEMLSEEFAIQAKRSDLLVEMSGLSWSLGIVDLRPLIAFQRRLSFHPELPQVPIPDARQWSALLSLSFGSAKPIECETIHDRSAQTLTLQSSNPNLHFRITSDPTSPLSIHTGGPFFEVACFRGRWFLRDGYHRAYALLNAGVFEIPAVIVYATTIEELGASQPWFFSEEVLFSEAPPCVVDFLDSDLVLEYDRPPLIRTLRITMEETLIPAASIGDPS
jgi:hypothetical protein